MKTQNNFMDSVKSSLYGPDHRHAGRLRSYLSGLDCLAGTRLPRRETV